MSRLVWPGVVALLAAAAPAWGAARLPTGPVPAWVEPVTPEPTGPGRGQGGVEALLDDFQLLLGKRPARYVHHAARVIASDGLDAFSTLRMEYDPSYQHVEVHFVRVRRGGETADLLRTAAVKLIDREENLEGRLFDGRRTLLVVLHDVRVGDVIEWAFTITGANPVFGGHALGELNLGGYRQVRRDFTRILITDPRPLTIALRGGARPPARRVTAAGTEHVWDLRDPPQVEAEGREPNWFDPYPHALLTDFFSWEDVVEWALPLYPPRPLSPPLKARLVELRAGALEDRILAALRFVQDDVRYLGFEVGPNSHAPHDPEAVLAQRFGDCKDKSYLLVTLLRGLGVDADPVMVDSTPDQRPYEDAPSPLAFDHVIVRATVGGRVYWLDPTLSLQGGTLRTLSTPRYGRALVVRKGTSGLVDLPEDRDDGPLVTLNERYQVESDGGASLEVDTIYRRDAADDARARFVSAEPKDLSRWFVNFYAKRHPSIRVMRSPSVTDDRPGNRLVVRETYAIGSIWKDDEVWMRGHLLDDELHAPSIRLRKNPLALTYPLHMQHNVEVLLPTVFNIETVDRKIERSGLAFHKVVEQSGRLVSMRYTLKGTAREVAAPEVNAYLKTLDEIRASLDYGFTVRGYTKSSSMDKWEVLIGVGGLVVIIGVPVGGFFGIRRFFRRRRLRALRKRYEPTAGEMASAAITASSDEEARSAGERLRCACGGRLFLPGEPVFETSRLGDQVVRSARFRCDRCSRERPVYFKAP